MEMNNTFQRLRYQALQKPTGACGWRCRGGVLCAVVVCRPAAAQHLPHLPANEMRLLISIFPFLPSSSLVPLIAHLLGPPPPANHSPNHTFSSQSYGVFKSIPHTFSL